MNKIVVDVLSAMPILLISLPLGASLIIFSEPGEILSYYRVIVEKFWKLVLKDKLPQYKWVLKPFYTCGRCVCGWVHIFTCILLILLGYQIGLIEILITTIWAMLLSPIIIKAND